MAIGGALLKFGLPFLTGLASVDQLTDGAMESFGRGAAGVVGQPQSEPGLSGGVVDAEYQLELVEELRNLAWFDDGQEVDIFSDDICHADVPTIHGKVCGCE